MHMEINKRAGVSSVKSKICQSVVKAVDKATGDNIPTGGAVGEIWRAAKDKEVALGWIKAHVGIPGNEAADIAAKRGAGMEEGTRVEPAVGGRTVAQTLAARKKSRYRPAWGGGAPLRWSRKACTAYTRLRTGRGNIGSWRARVGTGGPECMRCGEDEAGGDHRVFWCEEVEKERPRRKPPGESEEREWRSWEEVDEWARQKELGPEVEGWFEDIGG